MTKRKALAQDTTLTAFNGQLRVLNTGAGADPDGAPFGDAPDELAHALVEPEQLVEPAPAPARAPQRQRQRRITAEVSKAETKLIQLARSREESLRHHAASWDHKRAAFIDALPEDVQAALVAMKVLEPADD